MRSTIICMISLLMMMAILLGLAQEVFALNGTVKENYATGQAGEPVAQAQYVADTVWVLFTAFLVFFMQAGFAMVESGFTRAKNAVNILMKNLLDFAMSSIAFWAVGFAIMFGDGNGFLGLSGWFVNASTKAFSALNWTSVPTMAAWMFQLVFAGTAATIVSGAMAERTKFQSYLLYSLVISAVIYPIVGHWIWGGGWLAERGMLDFAGSTVVHSTGGWIALAGAMTLGPRIGKYDERGRVRPIPGHNIPLAALGVFILWLGWFGFNPGSTMAATASDIAHIAVTTNLAAAAGTIAAVLTAWKVLKKPDVGMALNGALAGLVGITAPCAFVSNTAAILIGFVAGILVVLSVLFFDQIKIDDPVGAISVHGVCGAWGTLALGLFHTEQGIFYAADQATAWQFLGAQTLGILSVFIWCMATGFLMFKTIKATMGLRVSPEEELEGLDYGEHGASAYPDFQVTAVH